MAAGSGEFLHAIAESSRPTGSGAEQRARRLCAARLTAAGFSVSERRFDYSAFPGLWGTPTIGVLLGVTGGWTVLLARGGRFGTTSAATAFGAVCAIAALGWWLGRVGTISLPLMRRTGINLEASRGVPGVWLVAHLDTKNQPVPLLVRAAGVVITLVGCASLLLVCVGVLTGTISGDWAALPGWILVIGAIPLALSWVHHGGGTGALDNASGVAAVLRAAELVDPALPIGVLVTSAEELGLAGARAWLAARTGTGVAINCDGVDDNGTPTCTVALDGGIFHGSIAALTTGDHSASALRIRRSIPGVLFDSNAFAGAGWPAATVSVGGLRSLARVHTGADTLDQLCGNNVERTARLIARLAGSIIAGNHPCSRLPVDSRAAVDEREEDGSRRD